MILRELIVALGLDFKDGDFKKAEGAINKVKVVAEKLGGTLAAGAIVYGLWQIVSSSTQAADSIGKLAEAFGISASELQRLVYAADIGNVGADQLRTALSRVAMTAGEASQGSTEAAKKFARLGVSTHTAAGQLKSTDQLFYEIADSIAATKNPTERAARAVAIFGRDGARLVPFLSGGAKGIKALGGELDALGGGFSDAFIKQSDAFQDNITRLGAAWQGIKRIITEAVLPAFDWLVRTVTYLLAGFNRLQTGTEFVRVALLGLGAIALAVGAKMLIPWLGIIASAVLAIAVFLVWVALIEDIYMYLTGGESAIGRFVDALMGLESANPVIQGLITAVQFLVYVIGSTVGFVGETLGAIMALFTGNTEGFAAVWEGITSALGLAASAWREVFTGFVDWVSEKVDGIGRAIRETISKLPGGGALLAANSWVANQVGATGVASFFSPGASGTMPAPAGGGTSIINAPNVQASINVNATSGQDPTAIAVEVKRQFDANMQSVTEDAYMALVPGIAAARP